MLMCQESVFFLGVTFALVAGQSSLSSSCLECMCQGSSGCQDNQCHSGGPGNYYCGPFHISYGYWADGGSPGADINNPLDFEQCLNERTCAEATVRGYMQKWGHDCDGNGVINCYDFAKIHKAGPYGCNGTWVETTDYWKVFLQCYGF